MVFSGVQGGCPGMGRPQVERRVRLEFPRRSGHPRHRVPEVTGMDKVFRESVKEGKIPGPSCE